MSPRVALLLFLANLTSCRVEAVAKKQFLKTQRFPTGSVQLSDANTAVHEAQLILESFAFKSYQAAVKHMGPEKMLVYRTRCGLDALTEDNMTTGSIGNTLLGFVSKAASHLLQEGPIKSCDHAENCRLPAAEAMVAFTALERCGSSEMTDSMDIAKDALRQEAKESLSTAFHLLNSSAPVKVDAFNMSTALELVRSLHCTRNGETPLCDDKSEALKKVQVVNAALQAVNAGQIVDELATHEGSEAKLWRIQPWTQERLTHSLKPSGCNTSDDKFAVSSRNLAVQHALKMREYLGMQHSSGKINSLGRDTVEEDLRCLLDVPPEAFEATSEVSLRQKVHALHEYLQAAACMSNAVEMCATL
mmetsp:Transcript_155902/g.287030  ORF Transcript_155902/g.287030 Transcript_155902/m.287030 type:complete len:361 (-) Transcript_155902:70-1152(-)